MTAPCRRKIERPATESIVTIVRWRAAEDAVSMPLTDVVIDPKDTTAFAVGLPTPAYTRWRCGPPYQSLELVWSISARTAAFQTWCSFQFVRWQRGKIAPGHDCPAPPPGRVESHRDRPERHIVEVCKA